MEGTMKRLWFKGAGDVELQEVPIPEIDENGILVKIAYAGICGSDVHGYTKGGMFGGIYPEPNTFGHEFAGVVVETGAAVVDFKVGDRVWVDPLGCVRDPRLTCTAGGFGEYIAVIKPVKDVTVFILPDELSFKNASLIEPFGVGVHTKNRAKPTVDDKVLLFGAGPIGLMAWSALKHQGIENLIVAERMPSRIELARSLGAHVVDNTDIDAYEYAAEQFGTATVNAYERPDVTVVVDCVGIGALMGEYLEKGRCNSRFTTLGLDQTPLTIKPGEFMSKQFSVFGARGYEPVDIKEVIEVLVNGEVDITRIITGVYALEDYEAAFAAACDRNSGMKVVFEIDGTL
ncbi:MAG: alcohol dehydrogenase catalytic domain-containing protein [Eggerthellaceae bacterium]|nr:alcohol dehydrogenase catalytic domain-containing protein [Eggerthellaceae bacterium]